MKINFRHNSFFIKIADTSYFLELVFKLILLLNNWHHFFFVSLFRITSGKIRDNVFIFFEQTREEWFTIGFRNTIV